MDIQGDCENIVIGMTTFQLDMDRYLSIGQIFLDIHPSFYISIYLYKMSSYYCNVFTVAPYIHYPCTTSFSHLHTKLKKKTHVSLKIDQDEKKALFHFCFLLRQFSTLTHYTRMQSLDKEQCWRAGCTTTIYTNIHINKQVLR